MQSYCSQHCNTHLASVTNEDEQQWLSQTANASYPHLILHHSYDIDPMNNYVWIGANQNIGIKYLGMDRW